MNHRSPFSDPSGSALRTFVVLSATLSDRMDNHFLVMERLLPESSRDLSQDEALAELVNDFRRVETTILGVWVTLKLDGRPNLPEVRHLLCPEHILNHAVLVTRNHPTDEDVWTAFGLDIPKAKPGEPPPPMPKVFRVAELRPVKLKTPAPFLP